MNEPSQSRTGPFSQPAEVPADLRIRRSKEAIFTELDGETVILHMQTGVYSGLDTVGTHLWKQLEKPCSFRQLVDQVMADYEVTEQQCASDICQFLADLLANSLIDTSHDGSA